MTAKARKARPKKCRHDNNVVRSRGVCWSCEREGHRRIDAGEFTDEQLVEIGYWEPVKKKGRAGSHAGRAFLDRAISKPRKVSNASHR
jgi:ribosomal protein S19E (S16A)